MGTIIVGVIVFGVVGLAAHKVYQNQKKGKCCGCAYAGSCKQGDCK